MKDFCGGDRVEVIELVDFGKNYHGERPRNLENRKKGARGIVTSASFASLDVCRLASVYHDDGSVAEYVFEELKILKKSKRIRS